MSQWLVNRYSLFAAMVVAATVVGFESRALVGFHGSPGPSPAPQANPPVQIVPGGTDRLAARPGEKGATYYWLESQATRVTTRFADAIATAERGADGDLETRLTDSSGNDLGRLRVDRIDEARHVLQYTTAKGDTIQALGRAGAKPTLDWTNQQAYSLWRDRARSGVALEWQGGLMRPKQAAVHRVEDDIRSLDVEWAGGLRAAAERRTVDGVEVIRGRAFHGPVIVSRLTRDGVDAGISNWFPQERAFVWNLPGLSSGYFDPEILKAVGGWTFEPDIFWVNLQTLAFHHFKTMLDQRGAVAERRAGWFEKAVNVLEPALRANEPGCDGLHWLDGTVYRYCCDTHDLCYAYYGCTAYTWWQWWTSWQCDGCNLGVVYCFAGGHGIFTPYGG